jgi:hypothetical protein
VWFSASSVPSRSAVPLTTRMETVEEAERGTEKRHSQKGRRWMVRVVDAVGCRWGGVVSQGGFRG